MYPRARGKMEYTVTFHRDKDTKFCEIPRFTFPESDESHSDQKNENEDFCSSIHLFCQACDRLILYSSF